MTPEQKVQAILAAIQTDDAKLLIIIRMSVFKNLPSVPVEQLDMIMTALGISNG